MNKFVKGGLFLITLVLMIFAILTLVTGGMGALGVTLFVALGIGSALVVGSTGWDGIQFIINYFKTDEKKAPGIDQTKNQANIPLTGAVPA